MKYLFIFIILVSVNIPGLSQNKHEENIQVVFRIRDGFTHGERISFTLSNSHTSDSIMYYEELILSPQNPYPIFSFSLPVNEVNTIKMILVDREIENKQAFVLFEHLIYAEVFINLKNELFFNYSDKLISVE
jgi:hypothetical protein